MKVNHVNVLIASKEIKEMSDHTKYCAVGLMSLDDGQKFDVSVREEEIYTQLIPMTIVDLDVDLSNSKFGLRIKIVRVNTVGGMIPLTAAQSQR